MDQKTDAEIVARVLNGDKQAYALLIDAYKGPVFNLAFRMTGSYSDADDLSQEAFIKSYQKLHQFNPEKKFFTWLYTISINLIRNHLRKKKRNVLIFSKDYLLNEPSAQEQESREEDLLSEDMMIRLDDCLRRLPIDLREAIILKYHQNMTFDDVAAITGDKVSAVKMRIYRGLKSLEKMIKK
ncbi:MAG: RNA polymerase sigma factor [Deltaproteobacteria bacterium]